jgi:hypothetical protein
MIDLAKRFIKVAIIVVVNALGSHLKTTFTKVTSQLATAGSRWRDCGGRPTNRSAQIRKVSDSLPLRVMSPVPYFHFVIPRRRSEAQVNPESSNWIPGSRSSAFCL